MGNVLIAAKNLADSGTLSGGSWVSSLPLSNLGDRQLTNLARSTNTLLASTQFDVDLGSQKTISLIAVLRHNLSQTGLWRLRIADVSGFATTVFDSGWQDIWPEVTPFGQELWGEFIWGGKLDADEAKTYGISAYLVLTTAVFARYARIELDDQGNSDGYLQAGRLIVSPAWQPTRNLTYGWEVHHVDESRKVRSRGGQLYVDVAPKRRRLGFVIEHLDEDEMFGRAYELDRDKGVAGDVLASSIFVALIFLPLPHESPLAGRTAPPKGRRPYYVVIGVCEHTKEIVCFQYAASGA
jgi:hypothetical protein|tara:strand:- start:3165 stop:4052 length:888 start_codon:yes stop_codon:yes gene_type:complete